MTMVMVDLRDAAAAEARRVMRARAMRHDGDQRALAALELDGTWILRARRAKTRRVIAGRALLIWRVSHEDAGGRLVESALVAVAVVLARPSPDLCIDALERETRPRVEREASVWHETVERYRRAFAAVRLARERALTGEGDGHGPAYQPGLFDRRAERERDQAVSGTAAAHRAVEDRLASFERRAAIVRRPAELLLILAP
jgi:hypothetical protein